MAEASANPYVGSLRIRPSATAPGTIGGGGDDPTTRLRTHVPTYTGTVDNLRYHWPLKIFTAKGVGTPCLVAARTSPKPPLPNASPKVYWEWSERDPSAQRTTRETGHKSTGGLSVELSAGATGPGSSMNGSNSYST